MLLVATEVRHASLIVFFGLEDGKQATYPFVVMAYVMWREKNYLYPLSSSCFAPYPVFVNYSIL